MAKQPEDFLTDGIGALPGGMNSGIVPQLLDKNQVAFATNCTFRGGFIRNRPGLRKVDLDFGDDALLQSRFENAIFQGAAFFKSEYGAETIVASIGGRLFDIKPSSVENSAEVSDVSITGDLNSSGNAIAWLWQSERWMIINDGQKLPIFYDGASSRRSYGASQQVGITSIDFVIPAIGESVDVTLTGIYEGPYNTVLYVGDFLFQINPSASVGYPVTLKNLSATSGGSVASGQQLLFPTNLIAQLTAVSTNGVLPNQLYITTTATPYELAGGDAISIHRGGGLYTSGVAFTRFPVNPPVPAGSTLWALNSATSTDVIPSGAPVYAGFIEGSQPSGMVTAAGFVAPAIGATVDTTIVIPYTGPLPAQVVIGGDLYEITAAGSTPVPSADVNLTNVNGTASETIVAGAILQTVPEIPVSRMGAYGLGRNWVSLPDGRSFIGGDIVGGSSGTPALSNRDAVLHTTENDYLFGGGAFVVPGNMGDIRSMTFSATLDVSLGQGPLQVGTPTSFFSCQAPVDRTIWQSITNPILTQSLIGKGPLGQYGTVLVNSDILFRARDGLGSLILARREFDTWGNTPISREMQRVIDVDDQALLENSTAIQFDNRLLIGCLPYQGPLGVYHQGLIALNFDPVSSLRGKTSSIYDGLWTGIQTFQFVTGQFSGDERSFAFCYNSFSNKIELFELLQSGEGEFDNDGSPMTWSFETSSLFLATKGKGPFDIIKLMDGELYISDIEGLVQIQTWYRPDYSECWVPWHSFGVCAAAGPKQYRSRLGLGKPSESVCDPATNRPFCIGNNFQVRIQVTGACKFMGLLLKAVPEYETKFSVPICKPLCDTLGADSVSECEPCNDQGVCETFPLVFYNLNANKSYSNQLLSFPVTCPNGSIKTVYVTAGRINFTLPFPPDYEGVYPPLIMGCEAGGNIVRTIPDDATQEQIDDIVNEMINTCAQAIAESEVNCNEAPEVFSNEVVYFEHTCEEGDLQYTGTLPSWITLEAENSRLVGAAGVFNAGTQAEANADAQSALDEFGNAALTSGDLSCSAPVACISLQDSIALVGGTRPIAATLTAAVRRMMIKTTAGFDVINTASNSIVASVAQTMNGASFAISVSKFYMCPSASSGSDIKVYDSDGGFLTNISASPGTTGPNTAYDYDLDRIVGTWYEAGVFPADGQAHFYHIDPATGVLTDVPTGIESFAQYQRIFYVPGMIVVFDSGGSNFRFFNSATFALIGSIDVGNNSSDALAYATSTGKIYLGAETGAQQQVWVVDPSDLSVDSMINVPDEVISLQFNPVTGALLAVTNNTIQVIDPATETIVCEVAAANRRVGNAVDYSSGDFYSTLAITSLERYA